MASPDREQGERRAKPTRTVAFLGLGIMGAPMARNLAAAGIGVVGWNRTREKAERLADELDRVTVADTPAGAAAAAGTVISMVPDVAEVEAVLLGPGGAVEGLPEGGLAIDMSTVPPEASRSVGERLAAHGVSFLDAPVSGSRPKAEDGTLTIMVGGPAGAFERESAMRALKAEPMLAGDFEPLFKLGHMRKDVGHFLTEARRLGSVPSVAATAAEAYSSAQEQGLGERDFSAVIEPIATKFGLK